MPNDEYEVGYGKPPKNNQFRKGVSGNPRGRPKGKASAQTIINKVADEKIAMVQDGRSKRITRFEGAVRQLNNQALKGDVRATLAFITLSQYSDNDANTTQKSPADRARARNMILSFLQRQPQEGVPAATGGDAKESNGKVTSKGGGNDRPINVIPGCYAQ